MTMQSSDRLKFQNHEYDVIDVSKGSKFIEQKEFITGNNEEFFMSTACWRGYEVYLKVIDNKLVVRMYNGKRVRKNLDFTGSIIIARGDNGRNNTDFLSSVFLFNDVKELLFKNGTLICSNDISKKLKEYDTTQDTDGRWNTEKRVEFITKICTGVYGRSTYKWGSDEEEELDYE